MLDYPKGETRLSMSSPFTMSSTVTQSEPGRVQVVQQPTLGQLVRWGIASDNTDYLSEQQNQATQVQDAYWYNYNNSIRYEPSHQDNAFEDISVQPPTTTLQELEISTSDNFGDYKIRLEQEQGPHEELCTATSTYLESFYPDTECSLTPRIPNIPLEIETYSYNNTRSFLPLQEERPQVRLTTNQEKTPSMPWHISQYQIPKIPNYKPLPKKRKTEVKSGNPKRKYVKRMSKEEQKQNGNNLWQFLMRLLTTSRDVLAWTGKDLEFKIANKMEVARLWGLTKNRSEMNFDKFSRAMRYYYNKRILYHNPQCRLTYSFMRNPNDIVFSEMLQEAMKTLPNQKAVCNAYCTNLNHAHEEQYDKRKKRQKKEHNGDGFVLQTMSRSHFPVHHISVTSFLPHY